jgi:hypothetical protein
MLFSGNESQGEICAQKDFFVSLHQQALNLQEVIATTEDSHNSFVTGFSVLARQSGFEETVSMREQYGEAGNIALSTQKILENCP